MTVRATFLSTLSPALALSLALGGALLGGATPVQAQGTSQQAPQQQQPQQQTPAANFDEAQVESFVDAAIKVQEVGAEWQPRIAAAEDAQEARQLQETANTEMISAVEEEGLSIEEYNDIFVAAQANPELRDRIVAMIDERRQ